MNYDDDPDELRREAFELRRKAAATINNYRWAAQRRRRRTIAR